MEWGRSPLITSKERQSLQRREESNVNWWLSDAGEREWMREVGVWLMAGGERVTRGWVGGKGQRDEREDREAALRGGGRGVERERGADKTDQEPVDAANRERSRKAQWGAGGCDVVEQGWRKNKSQYKKKNPQRSPFGTEGASAEHVAICEDI